MKKDDHIDEFFQSLDFDIAAPPENHRERFLGKLKKNDRRGKFNLNSPWTTFLAMAASFLVAFLLFQGLYHDQFNRKQELASVSSEMKTTQNFYSSAIKAELYKLQQHKNPETEAVINDALKQLEILETDYNKLKTDLAKSGQDPRVIYAMISNFQQRIDLLKNVLETVKNINEQKQQSYENNIF